MLSDRSRKEAYWALNRSTTRDDERNAIKKILTADPQRGPWGSHTLSSDPSVREGTPVLAGTQVPVSAVLLAIAGGVPIDGVARYHSVSVQHVKQTLIDLAHVFDVKEV